MENWNQVAKYEQIAANSYGTAIEKMEAYTTGVEAAQNRLTAALDKISLKINSSGALELLYNTLATLADNAAVFSAALLASSMALNRGATFNMLGGAVGKVTSLLGNVGAVFSPIGNENAGGSYIWNTLKASGAQGTAVSLQVVQEMYAQSLARVTTALTADEKALLTSIQSTMLNENADNRLALQKGLLEGNLTAQQLSILDDTTITALLHGVKEEQLVEAMKATTTLTEEVSQNKNLLLADKQLADARRQVATTLLNQNNNKYSNAFGTIAGNVGDSVTRNAGSLAIGGLASMFGLTFGGISGSRIGNALRGASGQTIGTLLNGAIGGRAFSNLGNGASYLLLGGLQNDRNRITEQAQNIYEETLATEYERLQNNTSGVFDSNAAYNSARMAAQSAASAFTQQSSKSLKRSILKAFGGPAGIASMRLQIGMMLWSSYLKAQDDALKEAQQKFKDANDKYSEALNVSIKTDKYDKLSQGVDYLGRNISLTDEEYQEFLNISNELASIFPELVTRTDDMGNKFVGVGNSVSTVTDKVNELVDALKQDVDVSIFKETEKWGGLIKESVFGDLAQEASKDYEESWEKLYGSGNGGKIGIYSQIMAQEGIIERAQQERDSAPDSANLDKYNQTIEKAEKKLAELRKQAERYEDALKHANDELVQYIPSLVQYASSLDGISLGYSDLAAQQANLDEDSKSLVDALSGKAISTLDTSDPEKFKKDALANIQAITDLVEQNPVLVDIYYGTEKASTMKEADEARASLIDALNDSFGADDFDEQEMAALIEIGFKFVDGKLQVDTAINRIKEQIKSAFSLEEVDLNPAAEALINGLSQMEFGELKSLISEGWIGQDLLNNSPEKVMNLIGAGYQVQDAETLRQLSNYYGANIQKNMQGIEDFYIAIAKGEEELTKENVAEHFSEYSQEARESIYATAQEFEELKEGADNGVVSLEDLNQKLAETKAAGIIAAQGVSPTVEALKAFAQVSLKDAFGDLEIDGIADTWKELYAITEAINDTYKDMQEAREEQNAAGKLSVQTVLSLLSANENYAQALEVVNGQIQLKKNAEEIMAKVQLQALEATLTAAAAEKEMQRTQLQAEYLRLQAGETEIEVSNDEIDANAAKVDSLNALAKAYANTAQWAMYLAENEKLVAMAKNGDTTSKAYLLQQNKVSNLLKQARSGSYASSVQTVEAPKKPVISYADEAKREARLKEIEKQVGTYNSETGTFLGGTLDKDIELTNALLNEVRQTIDAGGSFESWKEWYPKPEDIKDATDATKDLLQALDALIDKEYEEMKVWDSVNQKRLGSSQYYDKKRASLENLRQYWSNKYNSSSDQLEKLEAEKELMQIDIEIANLDDEEAEEALEIAKLKGETVETQIELQKAVIKTSDTEKEHLERAKDLNELYKDRIGLVEASKDLIDKEYYQIMGMDNATAKYFKDMEQNLKKQIKMWKEFLETATNLSEQEKLEINAKIQNLTVDLANVDDEMVEDALSFLQNVGASQNAIVAQYQEKVATADTEQERMEYEMELNQAILERMKLEKEFFEFEKEVLDYEMEYFEGLPESANYTNQIAKMVENLNNQLDKSKEILQQAYNNAYQGVVYGYKGVVDGQGNRVYSDADIQAMIDSGQIDAEAQQNKDYQDAMIDYIEAQQALGDLYIEDFNNKIDAIERRIKELETSKANEWASDWSKEEDRVIRSAVDKMKEYYTQLDEYYQQEAEAAFDTLTKYAAVITDEQIEELVAKYNEAMETIRDNAVQLHEDIKDYQESVYSALTNEIGRYKEQLEKQKELVEDYYDTELEKLGDKQQSIARTNQLIELQNKLLTAQQEKERVYREGVGWVA